MTDQRRQSNREMTTTTSSRITSAWTLPLVFSICLFQLQVTCGRESALFPFGEKNDDSYVHHDINEFSLTLPYPIQFAGYEYKVLHLTPHGYLGFTSSVFQYVQWGKDVPEHDVPFLAPLYFEALYVGETTSDKDAIYYRMLSSKSELLKNLTLMIQESIVGANNFIADKAVIVTWYLVRSKIHLKEINEHTTNIFQLAIVFNQDETYAIFNYDRVNPIKNSIYSAGINAGYYKGWTNVIPGDSVASDLSKLPFIKTGYQEGRFLFRVTKEKPERGGCTTLQKQLSVFPKSAGMFGGRMLEISAPCLQQNMTLQCRFRSKGNSEVSSPAAMINQIKARCVVPRLLFRGNITLEFSTDSGKTIAAKTSFHIVIPSLMPMEVETSKSARPGVWEKKNADVLSLIWDHSLLTRDKNATVDVNLIGYMETRKTFYYKTLAKLGSNIKNIDGRFSFKPSRNRCSKDDCNFQVGMVEVKLTDPSLANNSLFLTTKILPLGWFFSEKLRRTLGRNWANIKCEEMKNDKEYHKNWLSHLSKCPCTLHQALADFGRWIPDANCNIFSASTCNYHEIAAHCIRSAETTVTSSGNQCCYRKDGNLMYSSDTLHGSTPDKAATLGKHPFDKLNHVPELSHWVWDVIPYYYCCLWGSRCNTYMMERPTINCKGYQLPTTVAIFGDPHIITFYGFGYTMQVLGTYWLLKSTTASTVPVELQGTFVLSNLAKVGGQHFSKLNAISLKNSKGDIIEVRMREPYDFVYRLDVLVNGNFIRFDKEHGYVHVFQNVAIFDNNRNGRQQNFTIITDRGIGIKLSEEHGTMPLIVTIPPRYKGKIEGLFGSWCETDANGLSFKNGTNVNTDNEAEIQEYTNEWTVEASKSLFHHHVPADLSFKPDNIKMQPVPHDFQTICGRDKFSDFCKHDYIVSNDSNVAFVSKRTIDTYKFLASNQKHAANCGQLDVKYGVFNNANYSYGSTIHVVGCNQGYLLKGHSEYECKNREGSFVWIPEVDAVCISRAKEIQNIGMIVGIAVGVVVAVFIFAFIICCIRRRAKPNKNKSEKVSTKDPAEAETMISMKDTKSV